MTLIRHFKNTASALLACSLLFTGCHFNEPKASQSRLTEKQERIEKTLSFAIVNDPDTLDPRLSRDLQSKTICNLLFEGLTRLDASGHPMPAAASSIDISSDKTQYRFTIRPSLWSDGTPVTAFDFEYAWKKILSPSYPSPEAEQLYVIKNARRVKEGDLSSEFLEARALDAQTFSVTLENPTPYFLELISFRTFFPVQNNIDEADREWAVGTKERFKCNGPFLLEDWKHNNAVIVKKNPHYWDADHVHIDRVTLPILDANTAYLMYSQGELDWAGSPLSMLPQDAMNELKNNRSLNVMPAAGTHFFRFNVTAKPLDHKKMRLALAMALNRAEIVEHVLQGGQLPATALVSPMKNWEVKSYFQDNSLKQANQLLDEVCVELKMKRENFPAIKILYVTLERNQKIAEVVQQQWQKGLGIKVELEAVEYKLFRERLNNLDYMAANGNWIADVTDPINFLEVFKYRDRGTNNTGWEHPVYKQLLNMAAYESDEAKRKESLAMAEKFLMEEMPIAPIFFYTLSYLKNQKLRGVSVSQLGILDLKDAEIDQ